MTMRTLPSPAAPPAKKFSLADIKRGKLDLPQRICVYGSEKVGKSSWASGAPGALFLCPENGTPHLDIARLPTPETWDELFQVLELASSDPDCKSLVIDPVNWLEDLVFARVVGGPGAKPSDNTRDQLEKHGGGFGKGYNAAVSHWRTLIKELETNHYNKGRNVIFLAHATKKRFSDPTGVEFDRYELQMHEKSAGLIKQWVDDILFFRHEILTRVEGGKTVAVATDARVVHTEWSKAWDAGNRSSLPAEMGMSWDEYWTAVQNGRRRESALVKEIETLLEALNDPELTKKVRAAVDAAKGNAERLTEYVNNLKIRSSK